MLELVHLIIVRAFGQLSRRRILSENYIVR